MDRTTPIDTIIPDTSDRSTESESISPTRPSRKKANSGLEKLRVGVQVTLFSRGKSSSLCDFGQNSSPTTTIGDISSPESPEVKSHQRLETVRRISGSQNTKESPFPAFLSPKKPAPHKMSASSQDDFNQLEKSLEVSMRLPSGGSIADENFFEAADKNEENMLKLYFEQSIEEEKPSKKGIVPDQKSVVHEEEDGEMSDEETKRRNLKHPIFLMDKEREIEELKQELALSENPNIHFIQGNFSEYYAEEEILGEGASGVVKKCLKIDTNEYYAVKGVNYRNDDEILVLIVKEFQNHSKLNHKNIIKVYELYIDYFTRKIYTVMELAECNEMFEVIKNLGHYSEAIASGIFKQILTGINYLHLNGVCHRDIKPNNILVSKDGQIVKITDFNVSKFLDKKSHRYSPLSTANYKMWTHTGTIAFTAPEVFDGTEYTEAIDMWSAGTVLYTMLCGYQPFHAEYVQDLIEIIKQAKYEFHPESWGTISSEAKQLIRRCLDPNYKTRCSPSEALMCPWIANRGKVPDIIIDVRKKHHRLRSIYETRSRENSSCKATPDISATTALAKAVSDVTAKRRSSEANPHDSETYRKLKNYLNRTQKKLSKFSPIFGQEVNEVSPHAEEASPQLKNPKSNSFGRRVRALQIQNLLEAADEAPVGNFGVSIVPIDEELKENIQSPTNVDISFKKDDNNRPIMIQKVDMVE